MNIPKTALWLGLFVLLADALSKAWIVFFIPSMGYDSLWYPYGGIGVFKNFLGIEFSIVHVTNKGAAWGALAHYQKALLYLRIVIILGLIGYLIWWNKEKGRAYALTLIVAGAIGNVIDYFVYGHVIDMFHFVFWGYDYPSFNVADAAIFLGVCGFLLSSYFGHFWKKKTKKATVR